MLLDGGTIRGGSIATDLTDPASGLMLTANGGTLDGSAGAVTLAPGSQTTIAPGETLKLKGSIANHGTIGVDGNGYGGAVGEVQIAGAVTLSGGATLALADVSTLTTDSTSQVITGAAAGATLTNIDNTIMGYGEIGAGQLALVNAAAGTINASCGLLQIDAGAGSLNNAGLMQALSGTLDVASALSNTGVVLADGGTVVLEAAVTGTGGRLELDGSELSLGGSVAAGQTIQFGDFGTSETLDIVNPAVISGTIAGFSSPSTYPTHSIPPPTAGHGVFDLPARSSGPGSRPCRDVRRLQQPVLGLLLLAQPRRGFRHNDVRPIPPRFRQSGNGDRQQ